MLASLLTRIALVEARGDLSMRRTSAPADRCGGRDALAVRVVDPDEIREQSGALTRDG
jgi:hypothetical protein